MPLEVEGGSTAEEDGVKKERKNEESEKKERKSEENEENEEKTIDPVDEYYKNNKGGSSLVIGKDVRIPVYVKQQVKQLNDTVQSKKSHKSDGETTKPHLPSAKQSNKFSKSFYAFLSRNHLFGMRHFLILSIVPLYAIIGGFIFHAIESPHEIETMERNRLALMNVIETVSEEIRLMNSTGNDTMEETIKAAYVKMLNIENRYSWSTFDKLEPPSWWTGDGPKYMWCFSSALFFSATIFMTSGYGTIAPVTILGRSCVVLYALFTIPLTLVVFRDLGQCFLVFFTKIYARLSISFRRVRGFIVEEKESISLPMIISFSLMALYMFLSGVFVYEYDSVSGPEGTGLTLFNSCYFAFISITTIGLGDLMPNNVTFEPLMMFVFFFGVPFVRVVNRLNYLSIENGVFGTMAALEHKIQKMAGYKDESEDAEMAKRPVSPVPTARKSTSDNESEDQDEEKMRNELLNNFTIHSIATFMKSRSDVYNGDFGRVNVRKGDL